MKIYIVGSVSSGKSTFANKISEKLKVNYTSLDDVVYMIDKVNSFSNIKRDVKDRDNLFYSIIQQKNWIVEDVGRSCFKDGLKEADIIILLEPPKSIRNYRIIKRFIKQRLGLEKCGYNPSFQMLKNMLKWSRDYDSGKDKLKHRISGYREKTIILRNKRDIDNFINRYST